MGVVYGVVVWCWALGMDGSRVRRDTQIYTTHVHVSIYSSDAAPVTSARKPVPAAM